jgi:single-stranded DNA-binding protein
MTLINEVRLSGRATRDAAQVGKGPYRFAIAHGGGKKRDSDESWPTEFFDVCCWHESAKTVRKGQPLVITGKLHQSTYEREGKNFSRFEIVANEIATPPPFVPKFPIPERPQRERKEAPLRPVTRSDEITDADIPF